MSAGAYKKVHDFQYVQIHSLIDIEMLYKSVFVPCVHLLKRVSGFMPPVYGEHFIRTLQTLDVAHSSRRYILYGGTY